MASTKALETGSGIEWSEWLTILEPHRDLNHKDMAQVALAAIVERGKSTSPEWWAQGVTVAFEQHIGRRKAGERCDGSFSVTVSKTFPGNMDEVLQKWTDATAGMTELIGIPIVDGPRISQTEKWRYWRCKLADGSTVSVNIQTKPNKTKAGETSAPYEKSALAINHDKFPDGDMLESYRAAWKAFVKEV